MLLLVQVLLNAVADAFAAAVGLLLLNAPLLHGVAAGCCC